MFAKFQMDLEELNKVSEYYDCGIEYYMAMKKSLEGNLDKYLSINGCLEASAIEEDWFPLFEDCHFFLSHSHDDETEVISLAGYLKKEYGIKCFVDSLVWGYANDLLKKIDNKYCVKKSVRGNTTYNYDLRNTSTAHVHLILQGALAKMINSVEAIVFVNTPNSLQISDIKDETKVASPWIYNELLLAKTFPIRDYKSNVKRENTTLFEHSDIPIEYNVDFTGYKNLKLKDFDIASETCNKDTRKLLDKLYLNKGIISDDETNIW